MKPTVKLAETAVPGGASLVLFEHDGVFFVQDGSGTLESSDASAAAEAMAGLACAPFRRARQPRILIGGLGLGFVLAAAREALPQKRAAFVVAEPVGAFVAWQRQFMGHLHPGQLDDPRLGLVARPLSEVLREAGESFHAILVNARAGVPLAGVTDRRNLPVPGFLAGAREALKDGGLLAVCTGAPEAAFEGRLRQAGLDTARESAASTHKGKRRRRYTIWLARKGVYEPRTGRGESS